MTTTNILARLITHLNVQGTFLDFQSVIRKIPNELKVIIDNHKNKYINIRYNVVCNTYVSTLLKDKKGCRKLYET